MVVNTKLHGFRILRHVMTIVVQCFDSSFLCDAAIRSILLTFEISSVGVDLQD